jgi:hypothetical protein
MIGTALYEFACEHSTSPAGWRAIAARLRDDAGDRSFAELSHARRAMHDRADDAESRARRIELQQDAANRADRWRPES